MAIGSFDNRRGHGGQISEINIVPLVDVMLVLLVIFIITAPLLTHAVKIDLPKASSSPNVTQADHLAFGIRADGSLFWNGEAVTLEEVGSRFAASARLTPQPELHIHADALTHYENVSRVMSLAAKAGLTRIGFVSDPTDSR